MFPVVLDKPERQVTQIVGERGKTLALVRGDALTVGVHQGAVQEYH